MHGPDALSLFAPSGQGGPAMGWFALQLVAIFAIFYFLIIRPQRKQQDKHRQLLVSLQKGDRVVTSGGRRKDGPRTRKSRTPDTSRTPPC